MFATSRDLRHPGFKTLKPLARDTGVILQWCPFIREIDFIETDSVPKIYAQLVNRALYQAELDFTSEIISRSWFAVLLF